MKVNIIRKSNHGGLLLYFVIYELSINDELRWYRIIYGPPRFMIIITELFTKDKHIGSLPLILELNEDNPTASINKFMRYLLLK